MKRIKIKITGKEEENLRKISWIELPNRYIFYKKLKDLQKLFSIWAFWGTLLF